jgi:hypothetical protein
MSREIPYLSSLGATKELGLDGRGTALLLITHDMIVVADIADEGGPYVCWAHRAACTTSANLPVPGRQ